MSEAVWTPNILAITNWVGETGGMYVVGLGSDNKIYYWVDSEWVILK